MKTSFLRQAVAALTVAVAFTWTAAPAQAAPFVYVTNHLGGTVSQYGVGAGGRLVPLDPPTVTIAGSPAGLAVSPDGASVYVVNGVGVSQFDIAADGALIPKSPASVSAGNVPGRVAVSPDGRSVYVTNNEGFDVSQYDVGADGALSPKNPAIVADGEGPVAVAVSPAPRVPTTLNQCKNGGWQQFGFKNQGRCVAFVVLTRICDALERHGIHLKFCPPTPPNSFRPN